MEELRADLRLSGRVFRLNEVNAAQDARSAGFDYDPQTQSEIVEIAAQLNPQLINALAYVLCDKLNQNAQSSATI